MARKINVDWRKKIRRLGVLPFLKQGLIQAAERPHYIQCPVKMDVWKLNGTDAILIDNSSTIRSCLSYLLDKGALTVDFSDCKAIFHRS